MWLSTAPSEPLTRWCQVRCLLQTPLFAKVGETLSGIVLLAANDRYVQVLIRELCIWVNVTIIGQLYKLEEESCDY